VTRGMVPTVIVSAVLLLGAAVMLGAVITTLRRLPDD
jgi:multisubunit Na+/H+ antiporter MnhG subunit